ncbi:hypothetical protein J4772_12730 [Cohnella sp. LGH]|uniref:hypothetical protein n=1 Tax=Cohnella sp. LGH TaxID=1619153 RepID=UPI001ADA3276|nr:hypothetical protein [Cohnella sp. LGH]QTH45192.1 hypothetical protein J4772_12730 [Cohnella sp. LGH]
MMLRLRLAKSMMEREEGMNHLWIQLLPKENSTVEKAEVRFQMPTGLYRSPNLNGHEESESGGILIDWAAHNNDVLLELYTQTAIRSDESFIIVTVSFKDSEDRWIEISEMIVVRFVAEEEMEETLELDQQVIKRVKELRNGAAEWPDTDDLAIAPPRSYELRNNKYAYLEQLYRVDF